MPEEIVSRILRLPGYGISGWELDEATNTLTLSIRQTAAEPYCVCGRLRHLGPRDPQLDGASAAGSALGNLDGVAAGGGASRALSRLWRADRTAALRARERSLHGVVGGGGGRGL
jgi:hypothetical protein